jgi:hypothetical protein
MIDGRAGKDQEDTGDSAWWDKHTARVREAAEHFR